MRRQQAREAGGLNLGRDLRLVGNRNQFLNRLLFVWSIWVVLSAVMFAVVAASDAHQESSRLVVQSLGFASNLVFATVLLAMAIARGTRSLLANVHLTTMIVLMVLTPMIHFLNGSLAQTSLLPISVTSTSINYTNAIVFAWLACFALGYRSAWASRTGRRFADRTLITRISALKLQVVLGLVALAYLAYRVDVGAVTRFAFDQRFVARTTAESLTLGWMSRAAPIFGFAATVVWIRATPSSRRLPLRLLLALETAAIFLLDSPIAAPRFWTGTVAIGMLGVVGLFKNRRAGLVLCVATVLGLLVLTPLDIGRTGPSFSAAVSESRLVSPEEVSYESYGSLIATEEYVGTRGMTAGRQLVGNLLFWIPRAWWPSKPIGSGALIASELGQSFTNVSTPLPAEGLINFGILGVPMMALGFGMVCRLFDDWYASSEGRSRISIASVVFPFFIGIVILTTRGDLLTGLSLSAAMAITALPVLLGKARVAPDFGTKRTHSVSSRLGPL